MDITLHEFDGERTISTKLDIKPTVIEIRYDLSEIDGVLIPKKKILEREDALWESTCMELFVKNFGEKEYKELNVSLDGKWNAYEFAGYREEMETSKEIEVSEAKSLTPDIFFVRFEFVRSLSNELLLYPASVIKNTSGDLNYFAPAHREKPDFHSFSSAAYFCSA